jgi:MerC mercury resistance protein
MNVKLNWDGLGIATSLACAIHCAILPLILSSLPLFGINIIHNVFFEWGMIVLAFAVGSYSLFHGYIKHHRTLLPVLLFTAGCSFLVAKQVYHEYEFILLFPAVILIISAHYINYRLCHRSKCSSPHHQH